MFKSDSCVFNANLVQEHWFIITREQKFYVGMCMCLVFDLFFWKYCVIVHLATIFFECSWRHRSCWKTFILHFAKLRSAWNAECIYFEIAKHFSRYTPNCLWEIFKNSQIIVLNIILGSSLSVSRCTQKVLIIEVYMVLIKKTHRFKAVFPDLFCTMSYLSLPKSLVHPMHYT